MHEVGDLVYFIGLPGKTLGLVKEVHCSTLARSARRYWYLIDWIIYNGPDALARIGRPGLPERFYEDELKKAQVEQ